MVFVTRQLIEKSFEHACSLYALFVDLRKAYDSIPRLALWLLLERVGVPPVMLNIIKSLHEGMRVKIQSDGGTSEAFSVTNGLRQGWTMAPVLFNIYFSAVISHWRSMCPDVGVAVRHHPGRKIVGDRTAKHRLDSLLISETLFADDAAAFTTSRAAYETSAECFVSCVAAWGLTVSVTKTKGMSINSPRNDPVPTSAGEMSSVDSFTYLGSVIHRDGLSSHDVAARIAKASRAFGSLRAAVFENGSLSLRCCRSVYIAVVLSTLLYGSEVWTLKAADVRQLTTFHRQCIRVIVGVTRRWQ